MGQTGPSGTAAFTAFSMELITTEAAADASLGEFIGLPHGSQARTVLEKIVQLANLQFRRSFCGVARVAGTSRTIPQIE